MINLTTGYRVTGNLVPITVTGNAGALPIFQVSNSALQIGTKSFKLKKLRALNVAAGTTLIFLGTGIAGAVVATTPPLVTINNLDGEWGEDDLPDVEYFGDLMAYGAVILAGGTITLQATVEEIG
jgi:hypothetical protein